MNNYQDRWSRYHDKPCIDGHPKSNNGWLYSAYAQKLGLSMDMLLLKECHIMCREGFPALGCACNRSPGKQDPPMSRDEILGLYWLGFITVGTLLHSNWNFSPYPIPKFNLLKTVGAFWRLRKKHGNELWQNGGEPHAFRFAFSVPLQDRAYILRNSSMPVPLLYSFVEWLSKKFPTDSDSSRLIAWRKGYGKMDREVIVRYFGEEHPFSVRVMS